MIGGESQTHRNITAQGICPREPELRPLREEEPRTEEFVQLHLTPEDMQKLLLKDSVYVQLRHLKLNLLIFFIQFVHLPFV